MTFPNVTETTDPPQPVEPDPFIAAAEAEAAGGLVVDWPWPTRRPADA